MEMKKESNILTEEKPKYIISLKKRYRILYIVMFALWEMQTEFSTPDLKDGFQIDVYVDPNLIEVFVNDGEYIISNCVYNLGTDIHQQGNVKYEMYTLEGTDVSEA